jgi:hypothetical protein
MSVCEECLYLKIKSGPIDGATVGDCIMVAKNSLARRTVYDTFAWSMIRAAVETVLCPECESYLRTLKDKLLDY